MQAEEPESVTAKKKKKKKKKHGRGRRWVISGETKISKWATSEGRVGDERSKRKMEKTSLLAAGNFFLVLSSRALPFYSESWAAYRGRSKLK